MKPGNLLDQALELHERGYVPLPLREHSKHLDVESMGYRPLHFQTKSQKLKELAFSSICFQLSQHPPTPQLLKSWFAGFQGNIGILGGHDQLVVLDFDRQPVFNLWREKHAKSLSKCPIVKSPAGYHVFLRCRTPLATSSLYFGRRKAGHLKSLGGYVVAPPSVLAGDNRYEWQDNASANIATFLEVENVDELGLAGLSPVKALHDKIRKRGLFEPE